jgi:hypothetical protein
MYSVRRLPAHRVSKGLSQEEPSGSEVLYGPGMATVVIGENCRIPDDFASFPEWAVVVSGQLPYGQVS